VGAGVARHPHRGLLGVDRFRRGDLLVNLAELRKATMASVCERGKTHGADPKLVKQLVAAERAETDRLYARRRVQIKAVDA
jgi:hypothetical protein